MVSDDKTIALVVMTGTEACIGLMTILTIPPVFLIVEPPTPTTVVEFNCRCNFNLFTNVSLMTVILAPVSKRARALQK